MTSNEIYQFANDRGCFRFEFFFFYLFFFLASLDSAKELETWYKEWCDAKLLSVQIRGDCTPRDSLGVDFESFSEMVAKLAPAWSNENAKDLLQDLFEYLDSNDDKVSFLSFIFLFGFIYYVIITMCLSFLDFWFFTL